MIMQFNISEVESLAKQLKESDESVSEMAVITKIFGTLPHKYISLRQAWMSQDPVQQTLVNLTARLLDEEASQCEKEQETALLVANKGWKHSSKQNESNRNASSSNQNKTTNTDVI